MALVAGLGCQPAASSAGPDDEAMLLVSAHGFEVLLTDLQGDTLHRWSLEPAAYGVDDQRGSFRRAWVQPDGGLLALIEYGSLWSLAPDSSVRWVVDDGNHHDAVSWPDGGWLSLTSQRASYPPLGVVYQDSLAWYDADGSWMRSLSLLDLIASDPAWSHRLEGLAAGGDDPLHANGVHRLAEDGIDERFQEGFVLVSLRATSELMVVDPEAGRITWWSGGPFVGQHDPEVLADGNLLLFDNGSRGTGSRLLELSFPDLQEVWSAPVGGFSSCCGTVQRLAGGTTLGVVTTEGRAVEVSGSGSVVWSFDSPFVDEQGATAKLFDAERVARPPGW